MPVCNAFLVELLGDDPCSSRLRDKPAGCELIILAPLEMCLNPRAGSAPGYLKWDRAACNCRRVYKRIILLERKPPSAGRKGVVLAVVRCGYGGFGRCDARRKSNLPSAKTETGIQVARVTVSHQRHFSRTPWTQDTYFVRYIRIKRLL